MKKLLTNSGRKSFSLVLLLCTLILMVAMLPILTSADCSDLENNR